MNCSFDDKTGIWSGSKAEKERLAEIERQQKNILETVKVYSSDKEFKEEILGTTKAKLTSSQKKSSWPMSGSNLQNFTINNHLNGVKNVFLKKKIGKNKFSISKLISSPIILEDNIIFSPCNHFMWISLVSNIPDKFIFRCIKNIMKSNC